jgi:hypothetical protein
MPQKIISKAEKILKNLELDKSQNTKKEISTIENEDHQQLSFFQLDDPILSDIRNGYFPGPVLFQLFPIILQDLISERTV